MRDPVITLLTDYGTQDVYAGVLHGVILGLDPRARVVDLTHQVAPQAVAQAAFLLESAAPFFPEGTVHVAVVDPGVGSARRILCARTPRATFLAPDNGLLTRVLATSSPASVRSVEAAHLFLPRVSSTFHGRDIFAPVAARLALGLDPAEVGPVVDDPVRLPLEAPVARGDRIDGRVVHVDRFGNVITNIAGDGLGPVAAVRLGGVAIDGPACRSYADRPDGALLALVGSTGLLEVAATNGDAAARLGARPGDPVEVQLVERNARQSRP